MTLLAILPAILGGTSQPQQVDRTSPVIAPVSAPLRQLNKATGWSKLDDEWTSSDRRLDSSYSKKATSGGMSLGWQAFQSLEWRTARFEGKTYPVLVLYQTTGAFEYPTLRTNWRTQPCVRALIFDRFPFIQADKYKLGKTQTVDMESSRIADYEFDPSGTGSQEVDEKRLQEVIGKRAVKTPESTQRTKFKMVLFPVEHEGVKKVRFIFEVYNVSFDDMMSVREPVQWGVMKKSPELFSQEWERTREQFPTDFLNIIPATTKMLDTHYFETPFEAFRDFFAPLR